MLLDAFPQRRGERREDGGGGAITLAASCSVGLPATLAVATLPLCPAQSIQWTDWTNWTFGRPG
jgi:hypothetical protein